MEPARAVLSEDFVPVNPAGLKLRGGGVASIGTAGGGANAESALGEIQAVAHTAADAVELDPADQRLVDAALVNQILEQPPDGVVGERGHDRAIQPETALQAARDIVLAAAFAHIEGPSGGDPAIPGIEPQHHLSQGNQ